MKAQMKKISVIVVSILVVALAGLMTYFIIPKANSDSDVKFSVQDVELKVGESINVNTIYYCSVKNLSGSQLEITVEDDSVADIVDGKLVGRVAGETTLNFKLNYRDYGVEKSAKVVVVSDEKEKQPDESEDLSNVQLSFSNISQNIQIDTQTKTIEMKSGVKVWFKVESNLNKSQISVSTSDGLDFGKMVEANSYWLKAEAIGSYTLTFTVNDLLKISYNVVVNESL